MNQPDSTNGVEPQMDLFGDVTGMGTAGAPEQGTRQ